MNTRLALVLIAGFIIATIVGTLSHEFGHFVVARMLGYEAYINYASTSWTDMKNSGFMDSVQSRYSHQIEAGDDFPGSEKYRRITSKYRNDDMWVTVGGPLQTMLTGTVGLVLLVLLRSSFRSRDHLTILQWFLVFLTLFWLRQPANLLTWLGNLAFTGQISRRGDEIRIAEYMELPAWTIVTITAIIGAIVLAVVLFKYIPEKQRSTFVAAGLVGGIIGYVLWLKVIGPIMMP